MNFNPIHDQREFLVACEQNSPAFVGLYIRLVHEEWSNETRVALEAGDRVGLFDGLLDTVYVLAGLANVLMTALDDDSFELRVLPEMEAQAWASAIQEVSAALRPTAVTDVPNPNQAIRAAEIVWSLGVKLGFPMEDGWHEVHASNMAKVDKVTGKVIRRDDGKILKPEGWVGPNLSAVLAGEPGNYANASAEV